MKKILFASLLFFAGVVLVVGCNNKSDKKADEKQADTAVTVIPSEKGVKLICKDLMVPDTVGNPLFDVFLSVDGVQTKINSILNCSDIPKQDYETHEIPKDAIAACGGWYGGGGDYYYVILRDGKPVVFEGWQDEQQEDDGYHWKEKSITGGK